MRWIVGLMALGMIVNIAVAWAIVLVHGDAETTSTQYALPIDRYSSLFARSQFGYQNVTIARAAGSPMSDDAYAVRVRHLYDYAVWWPQTPVPQPSYVTHMARGWPARALYARLTTLDVHNPTLPLKREVATGFPRSGSTPSWNESQVIPQIFPYRPMWPGFAINTLFYALIIGLLQRGTIAFRRSSRRARNQCPACGYPRGTSPVCTECGEVLA